MNKRNMSWRISTLLPILFVLFETSCRNSRVEEVFASETLNVLLHTMLKHTNSELLREQIKFRRPIADEEVPLNSLVLVDKSSELCLRLEALNQMGDLTRSQVISELDKIFLFAVPDIKVSDGKYYVRIPEETYYLLRDISEYQFMNNFRILIDHFMGNVYVATNTDIISRIDPDNYVFGGYGRSIEVDSKGYVRKGFESAEWGLVLDPILEEVNGVKGYTIQYVKTDSPAERSGILPGDSIIKINSRSFESVDEFLELLDQARERESIDVTIIRGLREVDYTMTK